MEIFKLLIIIILFFMIFIIKKKYLKIYFIFVSIILAIIAFNFEPPKGYDLVRHYSMLENCRQYGWEYIINHRDYSTLPVGAIYMYAISLLGNNGFLPAITSFITYMSVFIVMYKFCEEKKYTKESIIFAFFTFVAVFNYVGLISGIRNNLCLALYFYFLYNDLVKNKNVIVSMIAYVVLAFIHPSIFVLIFIRLLLYLKNRKVSLLIKIGLLSWSLLKNLILGFLANFTSISIINLIVQKMNSYTVEEAMAVANVPLYTFVYCTIDIVLLLIFLKYKRNSQEDANLQKYNKFVTYMFCFVFGAIYEYHFFVRMSNFLLMLNLIPIIYLFSKKSIINSKYNIPNSILKIMLIVEIVAFLIFFFMGQYQVLF